MSEIAVQLALLQKARAQEAVASSEKKRVVVRAKEEAPQPYSSSVSIDELRAEIADNAEKLMNTMGENAIYFLWFSRTERGRELQRPMAMQTTLRQYPCAPPELVAEIDSREPMFDDESLAQFRSTIESMACRSGLFDFNKHGQRIASGKQSSIYSVEKLGFAIKRFAQDDSVAPNERLQQLLSLSAEIQAACQRIVQVE